MSTLQRQKGAARRAAPRARLAPAAVGCVLLVAGILLLREAIVAANEFGLTIDGPRLAPLVVAAGWTVLAVAYLVGQLTSRLGHATETDEDTATGHDAATATDRDTGAGAGATATSAWRTPSMLIAALLAYALGLEPVGFVLASAAFFIGAARILGSTRLIRDIVVAVPLALVVYLAFTRILEIHLPRGVLGL
jgi:putative tricarboxylic transport membrane protein